MRFQVLFCISWRWVDEIDDHDLLGGLVLTSRDGSRTLALSPDDRFAVKLSDQSGRIPWSAT